MSIVSPDERSGEPNRAGRKLTPNIIDYSIVFGFLSPVGVRCVHLMLMTPPEPLVRDPASHLHQHLTSRD